LNINGNNSSGNLINKNKQNETIQLNDLNYSNLVTEWDDLKTRNIAYGAVIYDEFLKELASICQEHCIQQCI
jgi:hypothetical protein